jgi:two-component system chemotaxis response regulator CheB
MHAGQKNQGNPMRSAASAQKPIRILIVDDSTVMRAVIGKILQEASGRVRIVGYAADGASALKALDSSDPDVVILDLAMPNMDGLTALPLILKKKPGVRVIVCSSLVPPGAETSVRALSLGAADCVSKPTGPKDSPSTTEFKETLKRSVLGLYDAPSETAAPVRAKNPAPESKTAAPKAEPRAELKPELRAGPVDLEGFRPKLVAVGSSTGGPAALLALLKELGALSVPVVITQHMIETFTPILVRQLAQEAGVPCAVAEEGMAIEPGKFYVAGYGRHLMFERAGKRVVARLDDGPLENFCKPAVDAMLRSAVEVYGGGVMAVILTGMGNDGLKGCREVFEAGGKVLVQDEASSIVWGMPGRVAAAGLADAALPLKEIAQAIKATLPPGPDAS